MKVAVKRIWEAIKNKEKIFVQGDYDCDGITSAVLVEWVLKSYGADIEVFIPNRLIYDYGATKKSVQLLKDNGAKVIITVDCGITSNEGVEFAKEQDIDFIITDHHTPQLDNLPDAFCIINPLLNTENAQLHSLAGVGVAFKLCHAFIQYVHRKGEKIKIDLREGLDLVAFGTTADFCPIIDENRILVKNGLSLINKKHRLAFKALISDANLMEDVSLNDILRILAPKVNAAGRIGAPEISARLFSAQSYNKAQLLIKKLNHFNLQRRKEEKKVLQEALAQAKALIKEKKKILVVVGHNWHPGIIGIITIRLANQFSLPCIVLNKLEKDKIYHGSGRSGKSNINLLELLKGTDKDIEYGGHRMALGVSVPEEKVEVFKKFIYDSISKADSSFTDKKNQQESFSPDGVINLSDLDNTFQKQYKQLGPFNVRTPAPLYLAEHIYIKNWEKVSKIKIVGQLNANDENDYSFSINGELVNKLTDKINLDIPYNILFCIKENISYSKEEKTLSIIIKDMMQINETEYQT